MLVCCSSRGGPPHAAYLFKHALVRDAAYGTLLREPRCALHARITGALESEFAEIAESQPELLAHHYTEASLIEKAASLWGKAGQRSLDRSALIEAAEQLKRALGQIATLPSTTRLRREQIKLQVALINPLLHIKGYAAPEAMAAAEQARLLIEQADALGEPPEDPLLLFSALYAVCAANLVVFNDEVARKLVAQFLSLAEKQRSPLPLMIGHGLMAGALLRGGDIADGRAHYDRAIALYDPVEYRRLATRFGQDTKVTILSLRSQALWLLGYPEAATMDANHAVEDARAIGESATLIFALLHTSRTLLCCGIYATANMQCDEAAALADETGTSSWKAFALINQGHSMTLTGEFSNAVEMISSGIDASLSTGYASWQPFHWTLLASAHARLGQFEEAWRRISDAMTVVEKTKERWCEAEIYRVAGEIALKEPEPGGSKAEAYFERALAVAHQQQAKSWELRAAMSMARLWRDQGKRQQAHDLLAPIYGWFSEGFDTLDLKEGKSLLEQLTK
jgi:predicted ATPase